MRKKLAMLITSLFLVLGTAWAQAPVATAEEAITGLLNRIGGNGAADKFEIVIDASLAENGKDVFVITSQNGKPCIKGNTQLSVATGINWYLNHYAHVNLTWNNLTTDLSQVTLPVPGGEEKHVCNAPYRYDFNTCTFSYSMAFWTWERWQQEIDWMALHGINAPLNLVGLDVVTRNFLKELGVSDADIDAYIAGPGFIAWFAMNNLEGWGGTIESQGTGVFMQGNPDWWYTRQEQLCKNMLQRMRELGMQPVIPGFSGQIPNSLSNYSISGFSSSDVINGGTWAGGYTRPDILHPNSSSYATLAPIYYKHLEAIMGVSELYSMDPFHEGGLPDAVTNATCYPPIMAALDTYHNAVDDAAKTSYNVGTEDNQAKWIIQYWQNIPQSGAFSAMSSYGDRFIGLDLFSDNIYAGNAAKWRDTGNNCYYQGRPYIYCMLHNFGGRSGMHGRLETTMNGYFQALANNNNCQGIGATPEGTETNPILYDMLFELPWMDVNNRPTADEWLEDYAYSRYGVQNEKALEALKDLKKSVWDCKVNQQGTSEAVILARPNWTVGSVSTWSTSAIYWDTQDVLQAADKLHSIKDAVTANGGQDGIANYNYDFIDVVRQAMVDYAAELLPLINAARNDDAEYTRLYQLYLQLMLDLDEMLSYDENFKLERWTSLARNIADEVDGTTENDRNWLEWNARTQITVWSKGNTDLHDYSNRCWAGLIKDFHYKRWEKFFTTKGGSFDGGWFSGFEYPWTVDFNGTYNLAGDYSQVVIPTDMTATEKAAETFGEYFGRVKGNGKNYIFPMGITRKATKSDVIPEVYRGQTVDLPLEIGKNVTISSVWVDLNNDGAKGNGETLTATDNQVAIPADAAIGKTTAQVVYSDGTDITFNLALIEDINAERTVTAVAGANGSVAIEGTNELSITTVEAVKMTATANTGYNFENWTDEGGNVVSNDNPYIYYGKEAATFTANFIQDKWGVPTEDKGDWGDAQVKTSFVNELTFAYYNREPETIYEATVAPDNLFNTISQIINVPQGASFDVTWSDDSNNGLKFCCLSAYIDLNADGDFTDEGELLKVAGTKGAQNTTACEGKINVILPYDAPLGLTHMRIRFDGAWKDAGYDATTKSYDAKAQLNRMCYELVINVTEGSSKAAHVVVESNNEAWGTAEVWTDETPGWTASNEWDVSASIPVHIKATKASEDVEFLGWYDHHGRLLTTELEYAMLAREDATYTARFRKALDIDGWQFEYRTEPGSDVVTTKLANGVKPVAGKTYYIYAPTRPTNNGEYVNRYLYNNSGTLTLSTTASTTASYLWVCGIEDGKYTFQNVADPAKYLKHQGLANAPYGFELGTGTTYYEGITLQSVPGGGETRNLFFVINDNGSGFNQSTRAHNQSTEDYTTDFVFTEVSTPDVVILTSVRQSGDHDLDIPETVDILGEQCKIVGFDNNLFKNNKDLWTISLPSTIEEMSNNKVFSGAVKGKGANASANSANYITTDLGATLAAGEDWSISLTIEDNGNNFNQWGSALIATGSAPMNSTYGKGFQLYLQAGGGLVVKTDVDSDDNKLTNLTKGTKFRIDIVYTHANTQLVVTATPLAASKAVRAASSLTVTQDMSDFSVVSHAIPEGVNITNLEVRKGTEPDPFEGCTNLLGITVDAGCEDYYVQDRTLYRAGGTNLHELTDAEKEEEIRALGELIDNTEALMDVITTSIDPVGKATEIALQTTEGQPYYIWCSNPHDSGDDAAGGVAALLDENPNSFLHTDYTNKSTVHDYLQVNFGSAEGLTNFKIAGQQRHNGSNDRPKNIEIYGSNDNSAWTLITTVTDLPNSQGATWSSNAIASDVKYAYLKFVVKTHDNYNQTSPVGRPYFHMAKFDLFKLTSTVEVDPLYNNITNKEAENVYDNLVNALFVYNNGGTADELQAAYVVLKPLYEDLNARTNLAINNAITELIDNTEELINLIATSIDSVGKATEIELQATKESANYYIWCSNPHDSGDDAAGGVAALLDENAQSFLHTDYTNKSASHDYLQVNFGSAEGLTNFKIAGQQRHNGSNDRPKNIEIYGSNDNSTWTPITTVEGLPNTAGATWASNAIASNVKYAYLKFVVKTHDNYNQTSSVSRPYFHMAKFDLFKLTSAIEVASGYKVFAGITDEEATAAYDCMVTARYLCSNGGTAEELQAAYNVLKPLYDGLNARRSNLNGVYNINFDGGKVFVGYTATAISGLSNDAAGYKLFDGIVDNSNDRATAGSTSGDTSDGLKEMHNNAIAGKVAADELFTIVPNSAGTGYTISAQGLYLHSTRNGGWAPQLLSDDAAQAGVYLVEESATAGLYKLKSNRNDIQYINDWGPVFGNDKSKKDEETGLSIFSFTPVTEYTLTMPASGVTTLCLPFNVVLPEGVVAYDVVGEHRAEALNVAKNLSEIAVAGDILLAGTPAILHGTADAEYTLTITMNSEGAKTSAEGSKLQGTFVKKTVTPSQDGYKAYVCDGGEWTAKNEVSANTCWIELEAEEEEKFGYYHINWRKNEEESHPMFIGYNTVTDAGNEVGYKMLAEGQYTTDAAADKVFALIPQGDNFVISVQGKYLQSPEFNTWKHVLFSDDANAAGVYVFHEQENLADAFKIQGLGENEDDENDLNYWVHNDYLEVYGVSDGGLIVGPNPEQVWENGQLVDKASIFTLTPVTTYAVAQGMTALCLPFNVILPARVVAYDIVDATVESLTSGEDLLRERASEGDILLAGTPFILVADEATSLTITTKSRGAVGPMDGSLLSGNFVKQTLEVGATKKYVLQEGKFVHLAVATEMPANSCWVVTDIVDENANIEEGHIVIDGWEFTYTERIAQVEGKDEYYITLDSVDVDCIGDPNLVIGSEYFVNGVKKTVVAISPEFLYGNETLKTVTIPATMTNLGFREIVPMFEGSYKGQSGDGGTYQNSTAVGEVVGKDRIFEFPEDPETKKPYEVNGNFAWRLTLDVTIDTTKKYSFNNYGSAIVSTKDNSLADYYDDHMQIYLWKDLQHIVVKVDNNDDRYMYSTEALDEDGNVLKTVNGTDSLLVNTNFKFELEHDGAGGYQVVIYYQNGKAKMYSISAGQGNLNPFTKLTYSLPEGIDVDVKFEKLISHGLFVGCTNLEKIIVDPANPTFMGCEHGVLYDKNQYYVMRIPEAGGELGEDGRRHFSIPSKVVKLYPGSIHGVNADIVLHSNPQIGVVEGHEEHVKNAKFYLSLDDKDTTIVEGETGYGGARDFISTNNNTYQRANYKRAPLEEGKYATFMLPFAPVNALDKYDFFKFKGSDGTSMTFTQVDELEAMTPYLYKLKDTPGDMETDTVDGQVLDVFESADFESSVEKIEIKTLAKYDPNDEKPGLARALGAYVNHYIKTEGSSSNYYIYQSSTNKFHRVTKQLTYRPYRALFVVTPEQGQATQSPARLSLCIEEGDGTATEIDASQIEGWEEEVYYDLMGRRVLNPTNGIYIVNGRKVVIE